jgi:hypothetical protein
VYCLVNNSEIAFNGYGLMREFEAGAIELIEAT